MHGLGQLGGTYFETCQYVLEVFGEMETESGPVGPGQLLPVLTGQLIARSSRQL